MTLTALSAPRIFDGERWHIDKAVLIADGRVAGLVARAQMPDGVAHVEHDSGFLAPGFVDLQINGGDGILLNDDPSPQGIARICAAQHGFGTTAMLPTLITDTPQVTQKAIEAAIAADRIGVPGFIGLHLEGPHLSLARKGAHKADYIRPMTQADIEGLIAAKRALGTLLVTLAPETVPPEIIARLAQAGIIVSLGHSDTTADMARNAFAAGASMVTHLFNAMSQLGNRAPGLVGAALETGAWAGLIADGIHVHPTTISVALRAQKTSGRIFLVTDAMAQIGTDIARFDLNGETVIRKDGALRLADGTLAGADLTMIDAVRYMHRTIGVPLEECLRMAALYPANAIGRTDLGLLREGAVASVVHIGDDLRAGEAWIGGSRHAGNVQV